MTIIESPGLYNILCAIMREKCPLTSLCHPERSYHFLWRDILSWNCPFLSDIQVWRFHHSSSLCSSHSKEIYLAKKGDVYDKWSQILFFAVRENGFSNFFLSLLFFSRVKCFWTPNWTKLICSSREWESKSVFSASFVSVKVPQQLEWKWRGKETHSRLRKEETHSINVQFP